MEAVATNKKRPTQSGESLILSGNLGTVHQWTDQRPGSRK